MRPLSAGEMLEVGTRLLEAGDFRARSLQADFGEGARTSSASQIALWLCELADLCSVVIPSVFVQ